MKRFSDYEKGFIEGVIDSDGSISISKRNSKRNSGYVIKLYFSNNSLEFLQKIQNILDTNYKITLKKGSKNYQFALSSNKAVQILEQIDLVVKEKRRLIVLAVHKINQQRLGKNQNDREYLNKSLQEIKKLLEEW